MEIKLWWHFCKYTHLRDPWSETCHVQAPLLTNPPTAPSHQKSTHTKNKPQSHIQAQSSSHTLSPAMPTKHHLNQPAPAQAQTGKHDTTTTISQPSTFFLGKPWFSTKQKLTKPTKIKLRNLTYQIRPTWIQSRSTRNLTSKSIQITNNRKKKWNFVTDEALKVAKFTSNFAHSSGGLKFCFPSLFFFGSELFSMMTDRRRCCTSEEILQTGWRWAKGRRR